MSEAMHIYRQQAQLLPSAGACWSWSAYSAQEEHGELFRMRRNGTTPSWATLSVCVCVCDRTPCDGRWANPFTVYIFISIGWCMEISRTEQQSKIDDWRDASGISLWLLLRDYSYISESAIASVYIYISIYRCICLLSLIYRQMMRREEDSCCELWTPNRCVCVCVFKGACRTCVCVCLKVCSTWLGWTGVCLTQWFSKMLLGHHQSIA